MEYEGKCVAQKNKIAKSLERLISGLYLHPEKVIFISHAKLRTTKFRAMKK